MHACQRGFERRQARRRLHINVIDDKDDCNWILIVDMIFNHSS